MPHVHCRTLGFLSALAVAGVAATQLDALAAPQPAIGGLAVQPGSMAARSDRHALIIGIGQYADPRVPSLAGIAHDMESARKMARALGVSERQTTVLRDAGATKHGVLRAIAELSERVRPGDRVFIYYSGHGTRWAQTSAADAACVEALLAFDRGTITNAELATALSPIGKKADKVIVMFDACHSAGVIGDSPRSWPAAQGGLTTKFTPSAARCALPANVLSRGLVAESSRFGDQAYNIVHISSSRSDEVSFDEPGGGGLATQAWRDCMLGDARDIDRSGAVSAEEIRQCAQQRIDERLRGHARLAPHHMVVAGNPAFVPLHFAAAPPAASTQPVQSSAGVVRPAPAGPAGTTPRPSSSSIQAAVQAPAPASLPASLSTVMPAPAAAPQSAAVPQPAPAPPPPSPSLVTLTGSAAAVAEILAQRDAQRKVDLELSRPTLRIDQDTLGLALTSSHDGYVYLLLLDSDQKGFHLLFPNELDEDNRVSRGQRIELPRPGWRLVAAGPEGQSTLLAVVTARPRDVAQLLRTPDSERLGPYVRTLSSQVGLANLQWFFSGSSAGTPGCPPDLQVPYSSSQSCSGSFAAAVGYFVEAAGVGSK